jgi:hypothetical protein
MVRRGFKVIKRIPPKLIVETIGGSRQRAKTGDPSFDQWEYIDLFDADDRLIGLVAVYCDRPSVYSVELIDRQLEVIDSDDRLQEIIDSVSPSYGVLV